MVPRCYRPCPVSSIYLQPMSRYYHISPTNDQYVLHLYTPYYPYSTQYLKPISSRYPIFTAHVKTISHLCTTSSDSTHLFSPCLVSTPSLQPISNLYHVSRAHFYTVAQLNNRCPLGTQSLELMSRQYPTCQAQTVPTSIL